MCSSLFFVLENKVFLCFLIQIPTYHRNPKPKSNIAVELQIKSKEIPLDITVTLECVMYFFFI